MTARKHNGNPAPQGFAPDPSRTQSAPSAPANPAVEAEPVVHDDLTKGLSLVLTSQIQRTDSMIRAAEDFTQKAAKASAQKAHGLASGRTFADSFVQELNALCEAEPFGGFGDLNLDAAEELLEQMGKPALPSPKPKFLPAA